MTAAVHNGAVLFLSLGAVFAVHGQSQTRPLVLPRCPQCSLAAQTPTRNPLGPPQLVFLKKPKPYDWSWLEGRTGPPEIHFELKARVVSAQPLVLDVLDAVGPGQNASINFCGLHVVALADAKLKSVLSMLKFNQLASAKLFYGGNAEYPHELILSDLSLAPPTATTPGVCFNESGLLVSYRGPNFHIDIYNDGSIFDHEPFESFSAERLSSEELAKFLKAFAANSFDTVASSPPPVDPVFDQTALTLICARHQHVSTKGLEAKLAPLLSLMDDLRARATSKAFYILFAKPRKTLTILEWPFHAPHLSQIEDKYRIGQIPPEMNAPVPADFLSKLPQTKIIGTSAPDPDPYIYVREAGELYRVNRPPCIGDTPHCSAFIDLFVIHVLRSDDNRARQFGFNWPIGLQWPGELGFSIADVASEGRRITDEDFEQHKALYSKLHEYGAAGGGASFIENGYLYPGVRICRVDPRAQLTPCTNPHQNVH